MHYESMKIGQTVCDFISLEDFLQKCNSWLTSPECHHVVTLNPEMVVLAEHNLGFQKAVGQADIRVPDGAGMVWAHWYIRSEFWSLFWSLVSFSFRNVERITGVDTVMKLSEMAAQKNVPLYLLGGTKYQVTKTSERIKEKWPTAHVHVAPPHRFSIEGDASILTDIEKTKPAILFVAYGAPYQTEWIEKHREFLTKAGVRIAIGVGGAFAILSEENPRAPKWMRQLNIEWVWRFFLEPTRLPRIWRAVVEFPNLVRRQKEEQPSGYSSE